MKEKLSKKSTSASKLRGLLESVLQDSEEGAELLNENIQSLLEYLPDVRNTTLRNSSKRSSNLN